jgi:hypothetical protein
MGPNVARVMLAIAAGPFATGCAATATSAPPAEYPTAGLEWNVNRPGADYNSFEPAPPTAEGCHSACMADAACVAFTYMNPGVQGPNGVCSLKNAVPPPVQASCCVSGTKYSNAPAPAVPPPAGPPPPPQTSWQATPTTPPPGAPPPTGPPQQPGWQGVPATPPPAAPAPPPPAAAPPPSGWQGTPATPPPAPPPPSSPSPSPPSGWQGAPATPPPSSAARQWEPQTDRPGSNFRDMELRAPQPELCRDACRNERQCRAFTYVRPGVQGPNARCYLKDAVPPARPADCCLSGVK